MIPERVSIDSAFEYTEPDTVIGKKTPLFQGKATRVHWLCSSEKPPDHGLKKNKTMSLVEHLKQTGLCFRA